MTLIVDIYIEHLVTEASGIKELPLLANTNNDGRVGGRRQDEGDYPRGKGVDGGKVLPLEDDCELDKDSNNEYVNKVIVRKKGIDVLMTGFMKHHNLR